MNDYSLNLSKFKTSSIGTDVNSGEDRLEIGYKYSSIAWFFVTWFGTTRMPYEISFTCKKSGEIFEVIKDKKLIEHYMLYRRK